MKKTAEILAIIARISGREIGQIRPEMELVADLGLDSSKAVELLVTIEDTLDLEIEEEDAAELNTVGDIINYISRVADNGTA